MSRPYNERAAGSAGLFGIVPLLDAIDERLVQPILSWRHKRATYRELMALDDRQLADIGLSRGDIDIAVFTPNRSHRV
jgi:uncharacterized protein YjiS (DUF1127 family)